VPTRRPSRIASLAAAARFRKTPRPGIVVVLESARPFVRLPDCEFRNGSRSRLALDARQLGSNQRTMQSHFFRRCVLSGIAVVVGVRWRVVRLIRTG
jgi:hypothetical protein